MENETRRERGMIPPKSSREPDRERLERNVDKRVKRLTKADRSRSSLFAWTVYLGTLGLVFVLPVVAGAYLGMWLDGLAGDYSIRWTLIMLCTGLAIGLMNVYFIIRRY
jgi:ATP synthase protein I